MDTKMALGDKFAPEQIRYGVTELNPMILTTENFSTFNDISALANLRQSFQ